MDDRMYVFEVTPFSPEELRAFPKSDVKTENGELGEWIDQMLENAALKAREAYVVKWSGPPDVSFRGVKVGSHVIEAAQHGVVFSTNAELIGVYEKISPRTVSSEDHSIIIMVTQ
jgi:hypothetical protein